ncbi:response regulator [Shouchella lehensis]|uniref:Two-component response regulator n=1 Tax=Shouchella lehensis G1 TaxID=1246626 RepID=A0A060M8M4_9BACI|nr:response regulator [Shouchella lehensis]AIC96434.1 two-component response regulator [Shouchella lehensis G1]RQW19026.1 response regulator [Bacillus sp. C1-1]
MIRVAMVEDEEEIAHFHSLFLKKVEGFTLVAQARTFEEGLQQVKEQKPDLLLLDVYIGDRNGLDILKQVRLEERNVDVILITSANDAYTVQTGYRFGVIDYLVKPFTFARFKEALDRYRFMKQETEQPSFAQQEIDNFLQRNETNQVVEKVHMPKGITEVTATRILEALDDTKWQTAAELEERTTISHVSLRKYLRYFLEQGFIEKDLVYLTHGRPYNRYRMLEAGKVFRLKS